MYSILVVVFLLRSDITIKLDGVRCPVFSVIYFFMMFKYNSVYKMTLIHGEKRMEKKLGELLNSDLLQIYDASDEGIMIIDSQATIIYCNDLWVELCAFDHYGYSKEKMIGMSLEFFINSGIGVKAVALSALRDKRKTTSLAYSLDNKALLTTATPFFNKDGSVKYVVAFVKDESEIHNLKTNIENYQEIQNMYIDYLYHGSSRKKQIVMNDSKVKSIYVQALKISKTDATVLISGESGTGKDVLANFIHNNSQRSKGAFIAINCGAIPENLVESEFFGYEKGAFTGANKEGKRGFFEAANKGTLFLDEISELSQSMQVKLLRAIENRKITRVGGVEPVNIDVRIIAATNCDLMEKVEDGSFRLDLFYRINVIKFELPPLRERKNDVKDLVNLFIKQFNEAYIMNKSISDKAINRLLMYEWPGNIRELRNIAENLILTSINNEIDVDDVDLLIQNESRIDKNQLVIVNGIAPLREVLDEAERQLLKLVSRTRHSSSEIAEALGIDQTTASRKLKKHNIIYK